MKKMENRLDEMQEQKLLHIEKNGCWFAFWALLVSMFVQMGIFGIDNFKVIAGEWIVFMALALYLSFASIRNGIWDRRWKADGKTNLIMSLISALIFGVVFAVINYMNFESVEGAIVTFVIMAIILFVGIFCALTISVKLYQKRVKELEKTLDE